MIVLEFTNGATSFGLGAKMHEWVFRSLRRTALLILVLAACTGQQGIPGDGSTNPPESKASLQECERMGFACTWNEVSPEVFDRTVELSENASSLLVNEGYSAEQVAEWLRSREDVAHVWTGDSAVRFRVSEGRPSWVLLPRASTSAASALKSHMGVPLDGNQNRVVPQDVVGEPLMSKRAIILAPFAHEDGFMDESLDLDELLKDTRTPDGRGYTQVNLIRDSVGDGRVTVSHFAQLAGYDVIHISTHGGLQTVCEDEVNQIGCEVMTVLATSQLAPAAYLDVIRDQPGIDLVVSPATGYVYVGVTQDFFYKHYQLGIEDAFIFVNGCNTVAGEEGLVNAMQGEDTVFFGWDKVVSGLGANAQSLALYKELLDSKRTTNSVYKESFDDYIDPLHGAKLLRRPNGSDQRLLEIITLLDDQGSPLVDRSDLTADLLGTPGDGASDEILLKAQLDGIEEGTEAGYVVRYTLGGHEAQGTYNLDGATRIDSTRLTVIHEVNLGRDAPIDVSNLQAIVELPEGGESRFAVNVMFGPSCEFDATVSGDFHGTFDGAARLQVLEDGSVGISLKSRGYLNGSDGTDSFIASVGTGPGGNTVGPHDLTGGSAEQGNVAGTFVFSATYLPGYEPADCATCGGTLTVDEVSEESMSGSFEITMPVLSPEPGSDQDPYIVTVTSTFDALVGSATDFESPYFQCSLSYFDE